MALIGRLHEKVQKKKSAGEGFCQNLCHESKANQGDCIEEWIANLLPDPAAPGDESRLQRLFQKNSRCLFLS